MSARLQEYENGKEKGRRKKGENAQSMMIIICKLCTFMDAMALSEWSNTVCAWECGLYYADM